MKRALAVCALGCGLVLDTVVLSAAPVAPTAPVLAPLPSDAAPVVRVALDRDTVGVGETVGLRLTVLVPTWFKRPPRYPGLEVANAVVRLPADSSFPTTERIGGASWSGIVRDYEVVPLVAGRFRLPAGQIRVAFADPDGGDDRVVDSPLPAIEFRAVVPAGAEDLDPYLAGASLELERQVEGEVEGDLALDALRVGDAVVVRVLARLRGMSALFLPPLIRAADIPGVSSYPAEPRIRDGAEAVREENVTYVFAKGGRYSLPGVRLQWWNTTTGVREETSLPEIHVAVEAAPGLGWTGDAGPIPLWWLAAAAAVGGVVLRRRGPRWLSWWRRRRRRWRSSEEFAFRAVRRALRAGDSRAAYAAVLVWVERIGATAVATSSEVLAVDAGHADRLGELRRLSRALYGEDPAEDPAGVDFPRLERQLVAARRDVLAARAERGASALAPLNPVVGR